MERRRPVQSTFVLRQRRHLLVCCQLRATDRRHPRLLQQALLHKLRFFLWHHLLGHQTTSLGAHRKPQSHQGDDVCRIGRQLHLDGIHRHHLTHHHSAHPVIQRPCQPREPLGCSHPLIARQHRRHTIAVDYPKQHCSLSRSSEL